MNWLCMCRPGCLAAIGVTDDLVDTDDGVALADHVYGAWPQEPLFDINEAAS